MAELVPAELIQQRILIVRGKRVLLDADLARFYGVTTFNLNKAVARNPARFPEDFAFRLTASETAALKFQSGISKPGRGGSRKPANVFTEQGVAMLASVLRSERAVAVSVAIVRAFVRLREMLAGNRELAAKVTELERKLTTHDGAIRELFAAIRQLLAPPVAGPKHETDFHVHLPLPVDAKQPQYRARYLPNPSVPRRDRPHEQIPAQAANPSGLAERTSARERGRPVRIGGARRPHPHAQNAPHSIFLL